MPYSHMAFHCEEPQTSAQNSACMSGTSEH